MHAAYEERSFDVETKADSTPVTTADLAANQILHEELARIDSGAGWLSEESADDARNDAPDNRLARERVWIVDPIDGTREFIERTGGYSISAGLAHEGRPVLGAVALPVNREILVGGPGLGLSLWTYDDEGSFRETQLGDTAYGCDDLSRAKILVSRSEWTRGAYAGVAEDLDWEPTGSIARKLALLAAGRADCVLSIYPKNEWDICGGAALVLGRPDGHIVELESGSSQRFNRAQPRTIGLAAGPAVLVEQLQRYGPREKTYAALQLRLKSNWRPSVRVVL